MALTLPVVVVVALGLLQVGIAVRNELAVAHAAREGARAVDLPIEVVTASNGDTVTVTVRYVDPTDVAIIGRFLGPSTHVANVTMAIEPP